MGVVENRWQTVKANDVRPGQTVRTEDGMELIATRIERPFLGIDNMVAFIEDTSDRWFKRPVMADSDVQVLSTS